ncbi:MULTISPECIES: DUF6160 family protein [Pseudomonas]|uniref:DUF6160 family protein n=1 Tax=Pseudomonas TaxID=286 RepID=UPI0023D8A685|nr:DUF6160 family protein [Pseudomonas sp. PSE14]WEJ71445.1 hypothetical protein O6P39_22730 [Pseudomonas sp. PSE14]
MNRLPRRFLSALLLLAAAGAHAEMRNLDDSEMSDVSGQDGVSLSVNFNLAPVASDTRCTGGCGARLAIQPLNSTGFIVLDNIKGAFSFDGMSLDIVTINSGFNGDGALFNRQAMKIGLTNASATNLQFTLGGANQGKVAASGLQQTNLLTYQATGAIKLTGNVYVFGTQ